MTYTIPSNPQIATVLGDIADLLGVQRGIIFYNFFQLNLLSR
jgi:hypothetical protein